MAIAKALRVGSVVALVFILASCAVFSPDGDGDCASEDAALKAKVIQYWPTAIPKEVDHSFGGVCDGDNNLTYVLRDFTPTSKSDLDRLMRENGWESHGDVRDETEDQPRVEFSRTLNDAEIFVYVESKASGSSVKAAITIIPK